MSNLPPDPLEPDGIRGFGERLRRGTITSLAATEAYLARIASLEPALGAHEHAAPEMARAQARAIDALLKAGTDLGPLMGVPVGIKDILAVDGMPTKAGSKADVADRIGPEGTFIKKLKRLGVVILGKHKTVEFAFGSSGTNYTRGTPRNPWDAKTFRVVAGSSSGSGVAVAAGLCGFAIGSDTGGSIRGPSAFCGVVGVKVSPTRWPLDGVYPASPSFDTVGPLTRSADDAAVVIAALLGEPVLPPVPLKGLRLGRPTNAFFKGVDADVGRCLEAACGDLVRAGVTIVDVDCAELDEHADLFLQITRAEFIASLGRERFLAIQDVMNPDVADRARTGLATMADAYVRAMRRQRQIAAIAAERIRDVDAWIAPTKYRVPPPYPGPFTSIEADRAFVATCAGPTRVVNTIEFCAMSQPIQRYGSALPVGFQLLCPNQGETRMLGVAQALEQVFGRPPKPDLGAFLAKGA